MKPTKSSLRTLTKKINYSTALGIFLSIILFVFIIAFAANDPLSFINLTGLGIVVGGTIAAILLSYPLKDIKHGLKSIKLIFFYEDLNPTKEANEIIAVAQMWFIKDKTAIENTIVNINNPYLKTGFQLIVDNTPVDDILSLLKWRIARLRAKEKAEANIFYSLASYSPAFGMLGTLIGMINMLQIIELKDIAGISYNMGVALITTFYGLIMANLIFNPIAIKLERRTEQRIMMMSMIMEGITLIADRRSPSFVRETLKSFIMHYDNELKD
ncbi:MAG: MotA/TolQ/ExbB proton channel family protein [Methylobacter sp.]|nr:MotA/TolQ/ExbB proton channel family protein [Methylobacter sp.]MDP2097270.1 MotA/TolQ/ExbB proton channel family protein [Methylobacter sp.]MDP2428444.1 MotA/TolQ/ExbB proton channel family protein [Methylobacter sp.]MDP3053425.1 MotA/TolQ/ExbB proton channel family protein [Methylobacter sp.]MDP3361623.1 MotA/TolQ/ExbB proton channel family protein [Methylobacter sp.]